jgi:transmembrane serine protease 9
MFPEYSYYGGRNTAGCRGQCVPIQECKQLLSLLKEKPLQPETIAILRQSQCGFEGTNPKVCCPNSPSETPRPSVVTAGYRPPVRTNEPQAQTMPSGWESHPNARLIPADQCGIDNSQRIWGGNRTDMEQYPWTALFQYLACKWTILKGPLSHILNYLNVMNIFSEIMNCIQLTFFYSI